MSIFLFHSFLSKIELQNIAQPFFFLLLILMQFLFFPFFAFNWHLTMKLKFYARRFNLIKSSESWNFLFRVILSHRWIFENANMSFCRKKIKMHLRLQVTSQAIDCKEKKNLAKFNLHWKLGEITWYFQFYLQSNTIVWKMFWRWENFLWFEQFQYWLKGLWHFFNNGMWKIIVENLHHLSIDCVWCLHLIMFFYPCRL